MKKIVITMCVLLAVAQCAFAGGGKQEAAKITKLADLQGKVVATLASPQDSAMFRAILEQQTGAKLKELVFFDTFSGAVAALKSNKADAVFVVGPMMSYYASRDKALGVVNLPQIGKSTLHMALRAGDTELHDNINAALISMRDDGTLARLEQEFISGLSPDKQLSGKDIPQFDGAPTLVVGLSGDVPPLDYVSAGGKPVGYNAELLALLSEKLGVNFEISVIPTESKFPALASNKIDLFFFHVVNTDVEMTLKTLERNNNATLSEPYFEFTEYGYLVLK